MPPSHLCLSACLVLLGLTARVTSLDSPHSTQQLSSFSPEVDGHGPNDMLRVTVLRHPELSTITAGQRVQRMGAAPLHRIDEWDFESDFCGLKSALSKVGAG